MALKANPTRTKRIEQAWMREINRRWAAYRRSTLTRLNQMNEAVLVVNASSDPFVMSASQQRIYMAFVEDEILRLLLETEEPPNWQAEYQLRSYVRGVERTRAELIAQGADIVPTEEERLQALGLTPFTATPSLSTTSSIRDVPIHVEALEFLFTRSYESLKGWTDALARETRQILFDAVAAGTNSGIVARDLEKRIGVSRSRARTIAQTEVNQAYSRSSLGEIERASQELGEEVLARWLTSRDSLVRHTHRHVHGEVMTVEKARQIKTKDGINCRCAIAPVVKGTDTPRRQARFEAEREQLLALPSR